MTTTIALSIYTLAIIIVIWVFMNQMKENIRRETLEPIEYSKMLAEYFLWRLK